MSCKTKSNRLGWVSIFTNKPSGVGLVIQLTVAIANGVCIYVRGSVRKRVLCRIWPRRIIKSKIGYGMVKEPDMLSIEIFLDNRTHKLTEMVNFIGGWNPWKIRKTNANAII